MEGESEHHGGPQCYPASYPTQESDATDAACVTNKASQRIKLHSVEYPFRGQEQKVFYPIPNMLMTQS